MAEKTFRPMLTYADESHGKLGTFGNSIALFDLLALRIGYLGNKTIILGVSVISVLSLGVSLG